MTPDQGHITKVNRLPSESLLYKTCNYSFYACNFAIVYLYKEIMFKQKKSTALERPVKYFTGGLKPV